MNRFIDALTRLDPPAPVDYITSKDAAFTRRSPLGVGPRPINSNVPFWR